MPAGGALLGVPGLLLHPLRRPQTHRTRPTLHTPTLRGEQALPLVYWFLVFFFFLVFPWTISVMTLNEK